MKKLYLLSILLLVAVDGFCQKPVVLGIDPSSAAIGETITLGGNNFNATAANNIVFFGGIKATVLSGNAGSLKVLVPAGADYKPISVLNTGTGLTGYSRLPFTPIFDGGSALDVSDFDARVDLTSSYTGYLPIGGSPTDVRLTDIDGDGKLDMAVLNTSEFSYSISILRNTSAKDIIAKSSFTFRTDFAAGKAPISMTLQDMDGDGKPDLIVANRLDDNVMVYHNNATAGVIDANSFGVPVAFNTGARPTSVSVGDIDGDGKPDIVVANSTSISILLNTSVKGTIGASSFAPKFDIAGFAQNVTLADLDGDGRMDIAGTANNFVFLLHNQIPIIGQLNTSSFAARVSFTCGNGAAQVAATDINNDLQLDLVVLNKDENSVSVLQNTIIDADINSNSFAPKVNFTVGKVPSSFAIGDLNGDGKPDIAIPNYTDNGISILKNNSVTGGLINTSSFTAKIDLYLAHNAWGAAIGDIDNDGRPDIAVTNDIGTVSLFRNNPANPPTITSIVPFSGSVGTTVTITGTNFNNKAIANNIVYFGAIKAVITSATATQLVVTVPSGSTYKPITVTNTETTRSAYSYKPFTVTYAGNTGIKAIDFERPSATLNTQGRNFVGLQDMDGDGKADLINTDKLGKNVYVALNNGTPGVTLDQQFTPGGAFEGGDAISGAKFGDIDGDGKPDIVTLNPSVATVSIIKNISTPGTLAFAARVNITSVNLDKFNSNTLILADVNMDGKLDIVVGSGNGIYVYRNTTSGNFISFAAPFQGGGHPESVGGGLAMGDIDGDGKPDIAYTDNNNLVIARNTSAGSVINFANDVAIAPVGGNVIIADMDNDGKLDVVANAYRIFRNVSIPGTITSSSFTGPTIIEDDQNFTGGPYYGISRTVADMDGDGKPEIIVSNENSLNHNNITIFHNNTSGSTISFNQPVDVEVKGGEPGEVVVGDLDGDNIPDILVNYWAIGSTLPLYYHPINPVDILVPKITSITPASGPAGTVITITGSNFNTGSAGNTVLINGITVKATTISDSKITITPPVNQVSSNLYVINDATKRVSNPVLPFNTTFPSKATISKADFDSPFNIQANATGTKATYSFTKLADMDGDGKLDLVAVSTVSGVGTTSIFRNISAAATPVSAASFAARVDFTDDFDFIGDVNNDGKPDLIKTFDGSFAIKKNTSAPGQFSFGYTESNKLVSSFAAALTDADSDGLPDMILRSSSTGYLAVSPNVTRAAALTFGKEKNFATGGTAVPVSAADFDGDGKPDVFTNPSNGVISIIRSIAVPYHINANAFDTFVTIKLGSTTGGGSTISGDVDGDGKPDLISWNLVDSTVNVLRNISVIGKISFAANVVFHVRNLTGIFLTDVNGDGEPDLVVNRNIYGFSFFINKSTAGNFTSSSLAPRVDIAAEVNNITTGDLDGDGKPDLVITNPNDITIYRNTLHVPIAPTISSFAPVKATKNTTVTINGDNFADASAVTFGGTPALSFDVVSDKIIKAVVPAGTTGSIAVTTPVGSNALTGFTYVQGLIIKPLADTITFKIIGGMAKSLTLADLATVENASSSNLNISITPATVDCWSLGNQTFTISVKDTLATVPSSETIKIPVKVLNSIAITSIPSDKVLPFTGTDKVAIPDYTKDVSISNGCLVSAVKITQLPAPGTSLKPGDKTVITITATDVNGGGSVSKSFNVTADINKSIVWGQLPPLLYGAADFTPEALPPTNSTVTFASSNTAVATITNNVVHITGAGTTTITATASGSYTDQKQQQLIINPALLNVTADDTTRPFGAVNPVFTVTYKGFVNGDTPANLTKQATGSTSATNASPVGSYPIVVSGAESANYYINYLQGTLKVTNLFAASNFTIANTSTTCKGSNNGIIKITAAQKSNYVVTVVGVGINNTYNFTDELSIKNLVPGTYNVCITSSNVVGVSQCYTSVISEPKDLALYTAVLKNTDQVVVSLSGADTYNINLNGTTYTTTNNQITLPLIKGVNTIVASTDSPCQGMLTQAIILADRLIPFPNPFENIINLNLGEKVVKNADLIIVDAFDTKVYSTTFKGLSGVIPIDVSKLKAGVFVLTLSADGKSTSYKMIKK